jgi:hypothetical protein
LSTVDQETTVTPDHGTPDDGIDLVTWAQEAIGNFTSQELGHQIALSMEVEVSGDRRFLEAPGLWGTKRLLSNLDREYIRALVLIGYRVDAAILVERAYNGRLRDREAAVDDLVLLNAVELEYLEMLAVVGQRAKGGKLLLDRMDSYQRSILGHIAGSIETRARLDKEYAETIAAIEAGGPLPPDDSQHPSEAPSGFFGKLLSALTTRTRR